MALSSNPTPDEAVRAIQALNQAGGGAALPPNPTPGEAVKAVQGLEQAKNGVAALPGNPTTDEFVKAIRALEQATPADIPVTSISLSSMVTVSGTTPRRVPVTFTPANATDRRLDITGFNATVVNIVQDGDELVFIKVKNGSSSANVASVSNPAAKRSITITVS